MSAADRNTWEVCGPSPWEFGSWDVPRARWWQRVLETDWATVDEIDSALGPEYRMWEEQR